MHKPDYKIIVLILFLFVQAHKVFSQDKVKNIVVFFSLSPSLPAYQNFLLGFNKSLTEEFNGNYNLITEYLDLGRLENGDYAKNIIDLYNTKYKNSTIDLFITPGPGMAPFLKKFGLETLRTTPTINIDFDVPGLKSSQNSSETNSLEILIKFRISETLEKAFELFPNNRDIYIISGSSGMDLYFLTLVENCRNDFEPAHRFTFISGMTIDSTINSVRKIPANSIVIVPSFLSDNKRVPFSTPEALNIISINSKAPVFPVTDSFIKKQGGIGGYLFSYISLGKETGRIASEILKGKKPQEITVNYNSFYNNIYDWRELKRWNLLQSRVIPRDRIFYNEDISFLTKYRWYIIGSIIFLISQTLLIFYLYKLNRKQREITEKMLETENMHRELIREDRMAKMTELTASLSHELNQPLTAILYSAQAGKRFLKTGKMDQRQAEEIFDNIIEDDKRAGSIISSVKSLMKLEEREKECVNLNALIQETVDIIKTEALWNRIKVDLNCSKQTVFVYGDKVQLQQVLMNFIRNATNAMQINHQDNKIIEIIMRSDHGSVTVSVRDFGPGIDESVKGKLFKPFVTTSKKGFGIGLALSSSIIERHDGKIWAENVAGGGAKFSFKLSTMAERNIS